MTSEGDTPRRAARAASMSARTTGTLPSTPSKKSTRSGTSSIFAAAARASCSSFAWSGPKIFTSIGRRTSGQIVEHVLKDLDELDPRLRDVALRARSHRVHDLVDRGPVARRGQPHEDVSGVLLGRGRGPHLGTGPAGEGDHPGRGLEDVVRWLAIRSVSSSEVPCGVKKLTTIAPSSMDGRKPVAVARPARTPPAASRTTPPTLRIGWRITCRSARPYASDSRPPGTWLASAAGRGRSRRAATSGTTLSEKTSDRMTAAQRVVARAPKKLPTTPEIRPSGANTTTVVQRRPHDRGEEVAGSALGRPRDRHALLHAR